jgi:hypothetical protein
MIDTTAKQEFMSKPKNCTYCQRRKTDPSDLECVFETGMCLTCDHAYEEEQEENLRDLEFRTL